ncbi:Ankyrin repeat protein, partial [Trichostrongylus colubriformis]
MSEISHCLVQAESTFVLGRQVISLRDFIIVEFKVQKLCNAESRAVYRQDANGYYPLHYAAYIGAEQMCLDLFDCMKDMTEMPTSGPPRNITPLHLAAVYNKAKPLLRLAKDVKVGRHLDPTAVLLSQQGAELCLTWRDKDEMTPLHFAAANGRNACIDWVLRKFNKISVNRKDSKGRSCGMLSLTSLSGPFWPLVRKSNLERCDNMGRGYLHRAVYSRNKELLIRVLEKCNPNVRDVNGVTPLHVAAAVGESEAAFPVLEALLQNAISRRSSPDSALGSGSSPSQASHDTTLDGKLENASSAVEKPEVEIPIYGRAGLLFAAYYGYLPSIVYLLEREPKLVFARDPRGRTVLHLASWRGHYQCVEYLIDKGAEIEAVDENGATALMYAVKEATSVHVVEYLLHNGADVSKRDCDNNTALHHCCLNKNEECAKVLTNHLGNYDPKREICNAVNNNGETALHIALRNG